MSDALHPLVASLVTLSRGDANTNIRQWLAEGDVTAPDLRYVARFLQLRDRGGARNDWRIGMAALFVAMPTLILAVFDGFTADGVAAHLFPYTVAILALSAGGVLWTLGFMLFDLFRASNDAKLLAHVELRLEMARWMPAPAPRSRLWDRIHGRVRRVGVRTRHT